MPSQRTFEIDCSKWFPKGVGIVGDVVPVTVFDSTRQMQEPRVQERDKDTGLPLWVVDVMNFDQEARERTFKVKIIAEVQPVPPNAVAGAPVRPVYLDGLMVGPWVQDYTISKPGGGRDEKVTRYRVAYSFRCTGLLDPKQVFKPVDQGKSDTSRAA